MSTKPQAYNHAFTERDEFVARIIVRAWKDNAYKKRLLEEPKAILAEELGTTIPRDVEVRVLEETANTRYIVLPYKRENFLPLSAEELASGEGQPQTCPTVTSVLITSPCDCGT